MKFAKIEEFEDTKGLITHHNEGKSGQNVNDLQNRKLKIEEQGNPDTNYKLWNIGSTEIYLLHMQMLLECYYI
jgi:hypothetical protein